MRPFDVGTASTELVQEAIQGVEKFAVITQCQGSCPTEQATN
jgi:hypothetical protein